MAPRRVRPRRPRRGRARVRAGRGPSGCGGRCRAWMAPTVSRTRSVPPGRIGSSMQSPPASTEATSVATLSPAFALPCASPRRDEQSRRPRPGERGRQEQTRVGPGGRRRRHELRHRRRRPFSHPGCSPGRCVSGRGCSLLTSNGCSRDSGGWSGVIRSKTIVPATAEHPFAAAHALFFGGRIIEWVLPVAVTGFVQKPL